MGATPSPSPEAPIHAAELRDLLGQRHPVQQVGDRSATGWDGSRQGSVAA
jgi:hypothetical protein